MARQIVPWLTRGQAVVQLVHDQHDRGPRSVQTLQTDVAMRQPWVVFSKSETASLRRDAGSAAPATSDWSIGQRESSPESSPDPVTPQPGRLTKACSPCRRHRSRRTG